MSQRPRLEVAEVVRSYGHTYRERYTPSPDQARVLRAVAQCRTGVLGGHVQACDHCGEQEISYNSCRNRHCPKCQGSQTARWLEAQQPLLLPVSYFHVVFTLPQLLAPVALQNPARTYGILFQAASRTLLEVAANPRHLGAEIGFLAVLHTWGQTLHHHPHIHCVVPAGGLAPDGSRWISSSPHFFLPVRVLSRRFRGKFLALLSKTFDDGRLALHGKRTSLSERPTFKRLVREARGIEWVVYAKAPFGGPDTVLKYLARYTHRVAISNHRLRAIKGGNVSFAYKDYARGRRPRTLRLDAVEFMRRFLLHALPKGFVRIRRYGLLANAHREHKLARCRNLLREPSDGGTLETAPTDIKPYEPEDRRCPRCGDGVMRKIQGLARWVVLRPRPPPVRASA